MLNNKLKSKINKILDNNYYTDENSCFCITETATWDNEQTLKNGYEILKDFLKEKGIPWKEFLDRMANEYAEDFMYDNYNNVHDETLQILRDELKEEYTVENEQDISDYIADKIIIGLTYKQWDEILTTKSNMAGGK